MYLLNNNRQWTKTAKGELNVLTENFQSHQQSQTLHHTRSLIMQSKPEIDCSYRLCMLHYQQKYNHDMPLTKIS